jgi:hypothetical protein
MSVADQLGLRGETSELLALPEQRWDHRTTAHPALTNCCGVRDLRSRLGGSKPADAGKLVTLECVGVGPQGRDIPAGNVHHEKNGLGKFRTRSAMPDDNQERNAQMSTGGPNRA